MWMHNWGKEKEMENNKGPEILKPKYFQHVWPKQVMRQRNNKAQYLHQSTYLFLNGIFSPWVNCLQTYITFHCCSSVLVGLCKEVQPLVCLQWFTTQFTWGEDLLYVSQTLCRVCWFCCLIRTGTIYLMMTIRCYPPFVCIEIVLSGKFYKFPCYLLANSFAKYSLPFCIFPAPDSRGHFSGHFS